MSKPRKQCCLIFHNSKLYIIGGFAMPEKIPVEMDPQAPDNILISKVIDCVDLAN